MDFKKKNKNLLFDLDEIKYSSNGIIERSNKSIIACRNLLNTYRKSVVIDGFKSTEADGDEINGLLMNAGFQDLF